MKYDTRNYGKGHQRFAAGGLVLQEGTPMNEDERDFANEKATREELNADREADIKEVGAGDPQEYELEKNRSKMRDQKPDPSPDRTKPLKFMFDTPT